MTVYPDTLLSSPQPNVTSLITEVTLKRDPGLIITSASRGPAPEKLVGEANLRVFIYKMTFLYPKELATPGLTVADKTEGAM